MKGYILAYKGIFVNFLSLSAIKGINMVFPLILIPYLIKTLGLDNYGKIALYQVVMGYFALFGTYGSDITAPRMIAMSIKDNEKLSEATSQIIYSRLIAIPICFFLLISFALLYLSASENDTSTIAWVFSFTLLLANLTNFSWFYQGIEKMTYVPAIYFFSQLIYICLVYSFIKVENDYIYVMFYQGFSEIVINLLMGIYIIRKYKIRIIMPEKKVFISYYKENFSVFITNISLASYKAASFPILKLFADDYIMGIYSIINKVIDVLRQILSNFFNVVYPRLCSIDAKMSFERKKTLNTLYYPFLACFVVLIGSTYYLSEDILLYFTKGDVNSYKYTNLFKFSLLVPVIVLFNIPAYLMLLVNDRRSSYTSILITASMISLILSFILAYQYSIWGILVATAIVELIITLSLQYVYIANYKNKPSNQLKVMLP